MLVGELSEAVSQRREEATAVLLGELEVSADAATLHNKLTNTEIALDELAERAMCKFLDAPKSYIAKCPPEFKAATLNFWLNHHRHATTIMHTRDNHLIAMCDIDKPVVPIPRVIEVARNVFDPNDEVVALAWDDSAFHLDVRTSHTIEVPPEPKIEDRKVGDITAGGVRFLATPYEARPPVVEGYFHRYVCTNGMTTTRKEGTLKLKGSNVSEIIAEMEDAAQRVLGAMDTRLAQYRHMAEVRVPGNPTNFAMALTSEANLGARVTERILSRVGMLPFEETTLYDVANVFTEVAQSGQMPYRTQLALQEMAGAMAFNTEAVLRRCPTCEHPVP